MSEKVGIPFILVANNFSTRETTNWNDHFFIIWQPPEGVILLQDDKVCESFTVDRRRGRSLALSMSSSSSSSLNQQTGTKTTAPTTSGNQRLPYFAGVSRK